MEANISGLMDLCVKAVEIFAPVSLGGAYAYMDKSYHDECTQKE